MNTIIITGGKTTKNFVKEYLNTNKCDIIIAVDKGLEILDTLSIKPDYILGDFDSVNQDILRKYKTENIHITELNPEKDLTDTHSAINLAISLKSDKITILGAIGTRIDHTIANIHVLKIAIQKNIDIKIIDENNEITLIDKNVKICKDEKYKYISLIPLTTKVENLTLKGFKYLLTNSTLNIGDSLGISNEQIEPEAEILLEKGILIMIKSKD